MLGIRYQVSHFSRRVGVALLATLVVALFTTGSVEAQQRPFDDQYGGPKAILGKSGGGGGASVKGGPNGSASSKAGGPKGDTLPATGGPTPTVSVGILGLVAIMAAGGVLVLTRRHTGHRT
jgi:LPXTG-motif cell wall-anchored protein